MLGSIRKWSKCRIWLICFYWVIKTFELFEPCQIKRSNEQSIKTNDKSIKIYMILEWYLYKNLFELYRLKTVY